MFLQGKMCSRHSKFVKFSACGGPQATQSLLHYLLDTYNCWQQIGWECLAMCCHSSPQARKFWGFWPSRYGQKQQICRFVGCLKRSKTLKKRWFLARRRRFFLAPDRIYKKAPLVCPRSGTRGAFLIGRRSKKFSDLCLVLTVLLRKHVLKRSFCKGNVF